MIPRVILNEIDTENLDINEMIKATIINSEAKKIANTYALFDINTTYDNQNPYVIIKCFVNGRIDESDRNFNRPF